MAKVVSTVPKLLTSTLGVMASDPPKPVAASVPAAAAPAPVPVPAPEKTAADSTVAGPDLVTDLGGIETRGRGRLGTIATSFRGVLNDSASTLPRRTLLGE